MKHRKFFVTLTFEIRVPTSVIRRARSKKWQRQFYQMPHDGAVAEHLAFNLVQGRSLSSLDGFADLADDSVTLDEIHIDDSTEVE